MLLVVTTVVASACSDSTGVERSLRPAIISGFESDGARIEAVALGAGVRIVVSSFGNGCREQGEVRAEILPATSTIQVRPLDWVTTGTGPCDDLLKHFVHEALVDVPAPGVWSVVIAGHDEREQPYEVTLTVVVP
jgi:hypothetical protein